MTLLSPPPPPPRPRLLPPPLWPAADSLRCVLTEQQRAHGGRASLDVQPQSAPGSVPSGPLSLRELLHPTNAAAPRGPCPSGQRPPPGSGASPPGSPEGVGVDGPWRLCFCSNFTGSDRPGDPRLFVQATPSPWGGRVGSRGEPRAALGHVRCWRRAAGVSGYAEGDAQVQTRKPSRVSGTVKREFS